MKTLKLWKLSNNIERWEDKEDWRRRRRARQSKDLEDSFLPLHVVAGLPETKKTVLSSLNYLLGILHRGQEQVRARNKEGRGRPWICQTRNWAPLWQEIGGFADAQMCAAPILTFTKETVADFPAVFLSYLSQNHENRRQLTDLLLVTHNKGFVSESFVFLFFPIYFCCDCSGRIISWYSRKKYKSRRERNHCRGRKHKSATLRTFWAWKWKGHEI